MSSNATVIHLLILHYKPHSQNKISYINYGKANEAMIISQGSCKSGTATRTLNLKMAITLVKLAQPYCVYQMFK